MREHCERDAPRACQIEQAFPAGLEADARWTADARLIGQLAVELGLPEDKIAAAYRDAPRIIRERNELREKFRTNPVLRFRAGRNRCPGI